MLEIENLDLWRAWEAGRTVCIMTNGILTKDYIAVMGRGTALQAKVKFPGLAEKLGRKLKTYGNHLFYFPEYRLITFPTKDNWRDTADYNLIEESSIRLVQLVDNHNVPVPVYLPRPGTGEGQLPWDRVKHILVNLLDDRFVVVTKEVK